MGGSVCPCKVSIWTPAPVLDRLEQAVAAIMKDEEVKTAFATMALEPVFLDPEAFREQMGEELRVFGDIAERAAISLD